MGYGADREKLYTIHPLAYICLRVHHPNVNSTHRDHTTNHPNIYICIYKHSTNLYLCTYKSIYLLQDLYTRLPVCIEPSRIYRQLDFVGHNPPILYVHVYILDMYIYIGVYVYMFKHICRCILGWRASLLVICCV